VCIAESTFNSSNSLEKNDPSLSLSAEFRYWYAMTLVSATDLVELTYADKAPYATPLLAVICWQRLRVPYMWIIRWAVKKRCVFESEFQLSKFVQHSFSLASQHHDRQQNSRQSAAVDLVCSDSSNICGVNAWDKHVFDPDSESSWPTSPCFNDVQRHTLARSGPEDGCFVYSPWPHPVARK
jgi:hypothetical protein